MKYTNFQEFMRQERIAVINKFQETYKTAEEKKEALRNMENRDIEFLIYCSVNIYACMFYKSFMKEEKTKTLIRTKKLN